jgi:hypothetical protein
MARRSSYYTPALKEAIDLGKVAIQELKDAVAPIEKILRLTKPLKYDTTLDIAKSLRWNLGMRRRWLVMRNAFIQQAPVIHDIVIAVKEATSYNGVWGINHTTGSEIHDHSVDNFNCKLPDPTLFLAANQVVAEFRVVVNTLKMLWKQTKELYATLPPYLGDHGYDNPLKKKLPIGGRAALSAIIAANHGWLRDVNPHEDRLFGWCVSQKREYDGESMVVHNLARVSRGIVRQSIIESKGPAPSMAAGIRLLSKPIPNNPDPSVAQRRANLIARNEDLLKDHIFCGNALTQANSTLVKYLRITCTEKERRQIRINHKVLAKAMGLGRNGLRSTTSNSTLTIVTGPITHYQGDDYYAQAVFTNYDRDTRQGWVLIRRNWPDMIHLSRTELVLTTHALHELTGPAPASDEPLTPEIVHLAHEDRILSVQELGQYYNVTAIEPSISSRLDESSRYYFNSRRSEAEKAKTQNQRVAAILRSLRSIESITREDSYAVSNCQPGTEQWLNDLALLNKYPDRKDIDGKTLARHWRKAKYTQMDRLAPVVLRLVKLRDERFEASKRVAFAAIATIMNEGYKDFSELIPITEDVARYAAELHPHTIYPGALSNASNFLVESLTCGHDPAHTMPTSTVLPAQDAELSLPAGL